MTQPLLSFERPALPVVSRGRRRPLFHQGAPVEAAYRLERGCVRLQLEREDGEREVIAFLFPGQLFCAGLTSHWASAYAVTDCVLTIIPRAQLGEASGEGRLARLLLASSEDLLGELAQHTARLRRTSAMARLRWFLGWLAERSGQAASGALDAPMSRRDIADFLGLAPETVSRLIRRMETHGELRRAGARRIVWDPPGPRDRLSAPAA